MINSENYKSFLPIELYKQIEEVCDNLKQVHSEAHNVLDKTKVPDATAQLDDVLEHTEKATNIILDSATAIQSIVDEKGMAELSAKINEHVTKIYEACSFQDITGQRIQKVLQGLYKLELGLTKLIEAAKAYSDPVNEVQNKAEELVNGPQLSSDAPSQTDIDKLFSSIK